MQVLVRKQIFMGIIRISRICNRNIIKTTTLISNTSNNNSKISHSINNKISKISKINNQISNQTNKINQALLLILSRTHGPQFQDQWISLWKLMNLNMLGKNLRNKIYKEFFKIKLMKRKGEIKKKKKERDWKIFTMIRRLRKTEMKCLIEREWLRKLWIRSFSEIET